MSKFTTTFLYSVFTIGVVAAFIYWAFAPGNMDVSKSEIEQEIEQWIGFDTPSDFEVIKAWDNGFSIGDVYYNYEIQFSKNGFEKFQKKWGEANSGLTMVTGDPRYYLRIEIIVNPESRKVFYNYEEE